MGRKTKKQLRGFPGRRNKQTARKEGGVQQYGSSRKLQGSALPQPIEPADGRATGYRLISLASLQTYLVAILGIVCRLCHSDNLILCENEEKRHGLMSVLRLKCLDCKRYGKKLETSHLRPEQKLGGRSYDVNRRAAFATMVIGETRSMEQFCAVMGMPGPPNEKPWRLHLKHSGEAVQQTAEESMQNTVSEIRDIHERERGQPLEEGDLLNEEVSFDFESSVNVVTQAWQ